MTLIRLSMFMSVVCIVNIEMSYLDSLVMASMTDSMHANKTVFSILPASRADPVSV